MTLKIMAVRIMSFDMRHRPHSLVGPGQAAFPNLHSIALDKNEGARNAGAQTTPQLCARSWQKVCTEE